MSAIATLPAAIMDTILARLVLLFITGAGGDVAAARDAASRMLAGYHPENEDELRLAAEIISFSFHALEALSQSVLPEISLNHKLRLRGSAVSLSRASHTAQRRLDQLQKARRTGAEAQPPAASPPAVSPAPRIEQAIDLIEATRTAISSAKATGQTWTQAYQQNQPARRIAENLRKNQARNLTQSAPAASATPIEPDAMIPAHLPGQFTGSAPGSLPTN